MVRGQKGFGHFGVLIVVFVLAVAGIGVWRVMSNERAGSDVTSASQQPGDQPPVLKNLGFNLDNYDSKTKTAGDFRFTEELKQTVLSDPIYQKMLFYPFGLKDIRPDAKTSGNVQPTFRLPLGAKVLAPIDGQVIRVEKLYSGDYTIWFGESTDQNGWSYETEHVVNPKVKVGDRVTAGQVVAAVSPNISRQTRGFGVLEIGLFKPLNGRPTHWCPFTYLDESIKADINQKILSLYKAWEDYVGDNKIYAQEKYPTPGCTTTDPISE